MSPVTHSYDPPERFVAGTVGQPGQRTFFLQARSGLRVTSVVMEKQQVSVLAERLDELLDEVMASAGGDPVVPAVTPQGMEDDAPLEQPISEDFRGGTMTLSWDATDQRIVVEVFSVDGTMADDAEEDDEPDPDEVLVVRLEPAQARAFCSRTEKVVSAGRASCPFCGEPMDPAGHLCVRANGFRRTAGAS